MSPRTDKITIVGSGSIGSTIAYSLLIRRPEQNLILVNRNERRAWAKAFDMSHCSPIIGGRGIRSGSVYDSAGSDIVVLTAGVLPKEDGMRVDVLRDNIEVYRDSVPRLAEASPDAVFVVVTNPVDAMAYAVYRLTGLSASRVLGSGTLLDSLRLRSFIGEEYGLDPERIEADIVGEHGESMVPLWSRACYTGAPLELRLAERGIELDRPAKEALLHKTRRAGWEIRLAGEHSCYGIAFSVVRIIEAILGSVAASLTVSSFQSDAHGFESAFMSLPTLLGREGIRSIVTPLLDAREAEALRASASAVRLQMDLVDELIG
ncbi:MAG: lactate/malate family dehydrogenase [Rectinemataceae bacterium]